VGIALEGEHAGVMSTSEGGRKEAEALQIRAVAANVFEVRIVSYYCAALLHSVHRHRISQSHLYAYNTLHISLLQDLVNNNEQAILGEHFCFGTLLTLLLILLFRRDLGFPPHHTRSVRTPTRTYILHVRTTAYFRLLPSLLSCAKQRSMQTSRPCYLTCASFRCFASSRPDTIRAQRITF
jgi:hypothetical protein